MAQSVATTYVRGGPTRKIKWAWTSDASGNVVSQTAYKFSGQLLRLVTDPDDGTAPTDNYDITITDEDGYDVLLGAGMNRDTANTEQVAESSLGCVADSKLTLTIANAGDSKLGKVFLYIRP